MLGILEQKGYHMAEDEAQAEIIIINTCGFIDSAKQESIDTILEYAQYKNNGNCKLLLVTGCLAERYHSDILKEMPEVDGVIGTGNYQEIVKAIEACEKGEKIELFGCQDIGPLEQEKRIVTTPFYTSFIKIAEGCDNHCTYCAIPQIRGKYRSRKLENIVNEAKQLVQNGTRELIVIAQDITRYGIDLSGRPMLCDLLDALCQIEGIKWIRLHYTYPELIDDKLISCIAKNEKIVKYLDIPIQHSEDRILKRMGRRTSKAQIIQLLDTLRKRIPDIVIRTSIIVGFPGETDDDFVNLCAFLKKARIDRLGAFSYSCEEGTPAAKLPNQVPERIKQKRYDILMEQQQKISEQLNQQKIGMQLEVLVEAYDTVHEMHIGRSYGDSVEIDQTVFFESDERLESGEFALVEITDSDAYTLTGRMIDRLED